MRIVVVGTTEIAVRTAQVLIGRGHEVIIVDDDRERLDTLSEQLDCSFLHGNGSKPTILREVDPERTDLLFCLSNVDQDNLIASLVGRMLGFPRVVLSIQDPEFTDICNELGLENTIVPSQTISRYLADVAAGVDVLELSTLIKHEGRFFSFTADSAEAGRVDELNLPEDARAICYYRDRHFALADPSTRLKKGDEVVILTHSRNLQDLRERWEPRQSGKNNEGAA